MRKVTVGRKFHAFVSDDDYARVSKLRWQIQKKGAYNYAVNEVWIDGKRHRLLMHRFILDLRPGEFCDHIDSNGLNNQRDNLRKCTHAENMRNRWKRKATESNPAKGVYKRGSRFVSVIRINGRQRVIGYFDDLKEAAVAYDEQARKHFGEFARPNFPAKS